MTDPGAVADGLVAIANTLPSDGYVSASATWTTAEGALLTLTFSRGVPDEDDEKGDG